VPEGVHLTFPTTPGTKNGPREWYLTETILAELRDCYPALDVLAECKKALAWVRAAPGNQKTASGMQRFLLRWMERAQNDGRARPASTGPGSRPPAETVEERVRRLAAEEERRGSG
jgi:hypothetical protein